MLRFIATGNYQTGSKALPWANRYKPSQKQKELTPRKRKFTETAARKTVAAAAHEVCNRAQRARPPPQPKPPPRPERKLLKFLPFAVRTLRAPAAAAPHGSRRRRLAPAGCRKVLVSSSQIHASHGVGRRSSARSPRCPRRRSTHVHVTNDVGRRILLNEAVVAQDHHKPHGLRSGSAHGGPRPRCELLA